jgi:hypothetical protein
MAADDNSSSDEAVSLGIMQSLWARFAPGKRLSAAETDAAKPVSAGSLTAPPALAQSLSPSDSAATLEGGQSASTSTKSTTQSSQSSSAAVADTAVAGEKAAGAKEVQTAVGAQLKQLEVRC